MEPTSLANLFTNEATKVAAIELAAGSFVLGVIVMCLLCKLFKHPCSCGKKSSSGAAKGACACAKRREEGDKALTRHAPPADGSIEIYVGNLSYDLTEDELREAFEKYGKVNSARIITNRYNGKSKGFGFIHMPNRAEVDAAIAALSDKELKGRALKCNEAKNMEQA